MPLCLCFILAYDVLQKPHQENKTHLADTASVTPSSNNLIDTTDDVLDSPKSSGQKIFSNMQFSFQDLKSRREKRLSLVQSSKYRYGKANGKRFIFQYSPYKVGKSYICLLFLVNFLVTIRLQLWSFHSQTLNSRKKGFWQQQPPNSKDCSRRNTSAEWRFLVWFIFFFIKLDVVELIGCPDVNTQRYFSKWRKCNQVVRFF